MSRQRLPNRRGSEQIGFTCGGFQFIALILIKSGRTYGLELKATHGRVSPAQQAAHDEMRAAGAEVAVAVGIDQALAQLEGWGLLRGQAQ